ncbi:MAG: hypothetical protein HOQ05_06225 [Corynebacteriales bacterium]|nr:hypothetical protein [Mycobacteriales bacterium]
MVSEPAGAVPGLRVVMRYDFGDQASALGTLEPEVGNGFCRVRLFVVGARFELILSSSVMQAASFPWAEMLGKRFALIEDLLRLRHRSGHGSMPETPMKIGARRGHRVL